MYICIDFDGTIVDHRFPDIGPPAPGALEWLAKFQEAGAKLILFTMRSDGGKHGGTLRAAVKYLEDHGIKLYGVNKNPTQIHWTTSPKAYGQIYIDDSAFGCPLIQPEGFQRPCVDWDVVGPGVLGKLQDRA
jgi:hydroxymethylpyrimidine pyrophosphatase-like HAD family hydrolase